MRAKEEDDDETLFETLEKAPLISLTAEYKKQEMKMNLQEDLKRLEQSLSNRQSPRRQIRRGGVADVDLSRRLRRVGHLLYRRRGGVGDGARVGG